jgi:hypothetical protein
VSLTALGSSSVVFAAPLSTFCRLRPGPQGLPSCGSSLQSLPTESRRSLIRFASSSERLDWPEVSPTRLPVLSPPASHRIRSKRAPRCRHLQCASTPGSKLPSARRYHPTSPVPSSWFLTTATASSAHRLPGLLHPGTSSRFAAFQGRRPPLDTTRLRRIGPPVRKTAAFPAALFTPLEEVPPTAATDASPRCVAPSPLCLRSAPEHAWCNSDDPRPRGLAPLSGVVRRVEAVACSRRTCGPSLCCQRPTPSPSMGLVPLQGS